MPIKLDIVRAPAGGCKKRFAPMLALWHYARLWHHT